MVAHRDIMVLVWALGIVIALPCILAGVVVGVVAGTVIYGPPIVVLVGQRLRVPLILVVTSPRFLLEQSAGKERSCSHCSS